MTVAWVSTAMGSNPKMDKYASVFKTMFFIIFVKSSYKRIEIHKAFYYLNFMVIGRKGKTCTVRIVTEACF